MSREEYAKAKGRLFSGQDVSGIYVNAALPTSAFPLFALVYRQPPSLRRELINLKP
jgi:hypothetical protein